MKNGLIRLSDYLCISIAINEVPAVHPHHFFPDFLLGYHYRAMLDLHQNCLTTWRGTGCRTQLGNHLSRTRTFCDCGLPRLALVEE